MNYKLSLIALIIFGILFTANFALAWEVSWPEIPGTEFTAADKCPGGCPPDDLAEFIAYLFTFALIAAGMVALLMLVLGAVQYVASAAMPSARVAARSRMTSAIAGLLLLFGSYVILNTINPELVMPGLGLSGTMGPEILTMPAPSTPMRIGVILYATEDCSDGGRRYLYSQETLDLGKDDNWDNRAAAFEIFKMDDKIQFFREDKFAAEASFEITGPRSCTKFADYEKEDIANSDFTLDVSSIRFIHDVIGVDLCVSDQPTEDNCRFFDAYPSEVQPQLMENVEYGNVGTNLKFYAQNHYDLCDWQGLLGGGCENPNPYSPINDNEIKWINVPCGLYAILCKAPPGFPGTGDFPQNCFFLLESSALKFFGDGKIPLMGGGWSNLDTEASFLMMLGYKDEYHSKNPNSDICKGVNFYTGKTFNRKEKFWGLPGGVGLMEEAAGFPIGWGDLSPAAGGVDLTTNNYNFTKVDDFHDPCLGNAGWWELNVDDNCASPYNISSLRMFGNCKLKILEDPADTDCAGARCEDVFCGHSVDDLGDICQPMTELCSCYIPNGTPNCACAGGSCAPVNLTLPGAGPPICDPTRVEYDPVNDGCYVSTCCGNSWNEDIASFILCNKDDNDPPCNFNCTF